MRKDGCDGKLYLIVRLKTNQSVTMLTWIYDYLSNSLLNSSKKNRCCFYYFYFKCHANAYWYELPSKGHGTVPFSGREVSVFNVFFFLVYLCFECSLYFQFWNMLMFNLNWLFIRDLLKSFIYFSSSFFFFNTMLFLYTGSLQIVFHRTPVSCGILTAITQKRN